LRLVARGVTHGAMGLMSLFGKGPLSEKKISKVSKLACNPFAQPDVRMQQMQKLFADQTEAAYRGVIRRLAANASGAIADEDEKQWLEDALVQAGEDVIGPLRDFIRQEKQLTYALRAYTRLQGEEEAVRFFLEVMEKYGPEDYRGGEAKLQLVLQLQESTTDTRVIPALGPFLLDHSDDVRWAIMDMIEVAADAGSLSSEAQEALCTQLGELVMDEAVGPRIQRRGAELVCKREWQILGDATELPEILDEDYFLDKKRFVRRRIKKKS